MTSLVNMERIAKHANYKHRKHIKCGKKVDGTFLSNVLLNSVTPSIKALNLRIQ